MKKNIKSLQAGDYIRTVQGEITKAIVVERINDTLYWGNNPSYPNECLNTVEEIKSVGSRKSDLVEVGDLIKREEVIFQITNLNDIKESDIILPKELFKKYSYKIGEFVQ